MPTLTLAATRARSQGRALIAPSATLAFTSQELVTGGELFDEIVARGNYTEKDAAKVMGTLCGALGTWPALEPSSSR